MSLISLALAEMSFPFTFSALSWDALDCIINAFIAATPDFFSASLAFLLAVSSSQLATDSISVFFFLAAINSSCQCFPLSSHVSVFLFCLLLHQVHLVLVLMHDYMDFKSLSVTVKSDVLIFRDATELCTSLIAFKFISCMFGASTSLLTENPLSNSSLTVREGQQNLKCGPQLFEFFILAQCVT